GRFQLPILVPSRSRLGATRTLLIRDTIASPRKPAGNLQLEETRDTERMTATRMPPVCTVQGDVCIFPVCSNALRQTRVGSTRDGPPPVRDRPTRPDGAGEAAGPNWSERRSGPPARQATGVRSSMRKPARMRY